MAEETASASTEPDVKTSNNQLIAQAITAVVTAVLAGGGVSFASANAQTDLKEEVIMLRGDVEDLAEKIDDLYTVVDRAHPRTP